MVLKADINSCEIIDWQTNTGEYNARTLQVEMCEEMRGCAMAFVTFELANGTIYESLIKDGKAEIPLFEIPQFVKIGAYSADIEGDKLTKRYSPTPCYDYVNPGSYSGNGEETPLPTPSTIAELTAKIGEMENYTIKPIVNQSQINVWDLPSGIYMIATENVSMITQVKLSSKIKYPCGKGSIIIVNGSYSSENLPNPTSGKFSKNVILIHCSLTNALGIRAGTTKVDFTKNEDGTVTFTTEFEGGIIETINNRTHTITENPTNAAYPTERAVANYAVAKSSLLPNGLDISETYSDEQVYNANSINMGLTEFVTVLEDLNNRLSAIEENPPSSAIQTWFKAETDIQPSATIEEIEV